MHKSHRKDRVSRLILEIVADLVSHSLKDPRVQGSVMTRVEVGEDLQLATVYFNALGPSSSDQVQAGLESARGFLRRELGRQLETKFTPDLRFRYDHAMDSQERIESILKSLHSEES